MSSKKLKFKIKISRLLAITSFMFFVSYYDPFGLDSTLEKHSNNLFYNIISPWFDKSFDNKSTVILLRESELEEGWPPSYEYHADVLTVILENEPKAIFIDLLFESSIEKEVKYLTDVFKGTKTAIYMAIGRDTTLSNLFFTQLFKPQNETRNVIPTSIVINSKQGLKYPMTNLADAKLDNLLLNSKYSERIILSLPAQLYCKKNHIITPGLSLDNTIDIEKLCVKHFIKEHGSQNFNITWRDSFNPNTGSPLGNQCIDRSSSAFFRLFNLFFLNISNSFKAIFTIKATPLVKQSCVPHQTLSVTHLLNDTDRTSIENLIEGNYVFYGVKLENTNDIISPPTHNALPGIYAHAMALENVLNDKNNIIVDDHFLISGLISLKVVWTFFVCLSLTLLNEYFQFLYVKNKRRIKHIKKQQEQTFIIKFLPYIFPPSISFIYLVVIINWIILVSMVFPFKIFNIEPLSGFDFAIAIGIIKLPNIVKWWNKKLEYFNLGEDFKH